MHCEVAVLALAMVALGAPAFAAASPLEALVRTQVDPTRMTIADRSGRAEGPRVYFPDGVRAFSICWWLRCAASTNAAAYPALNSLGWQCQVSKAAARPTEEGGPELPAFLSLDPVPLSSSGTFGTNCIPQDAAVIYYGSLKGDAFVVCANVTTDSALTCVLGGEEVQFPASNGVMQVRDIPVRIGDPSFTVAAEDPGATVSLSLAVNPWHEFAGVGPGLGWACGMDFAYGDYARAGAVIATNAWVFVAHRFSVDAGGGVRCVADKIELGGRRECETNDTAAVFQGGAFPKDAMMRIMFASMNWQRRAPEGAARAMEIFGLKADWRAWSDTQMWRLWELDAAELRRRGIDGVLPCED